MTAPLREFLRLHLTSLGGVVEDEGSRLHVLLPPEGATAMGVEEEVSLTVDGQVAPASVDARLGSPLLERALAARRGLPPLAGVAVPGQLPRPLPDHLPVLLNAVAAGSRIVRERRPARYLAASLHLTLIADEVRHATLDVACRLEDGALVPSLDLGSAYSAATAPLAPAERTAAARALRRAVHRAAPRAFAGALETLERRARRDLARVAAYYTSLDVEMARAVSRVRSDQERARRIAKRALLPEEVVVRCNQVRERLAARVGAELIAATLVETEVDGLEVGVRRRAREGTVVLRRRAGDGTLEGVACGECSTETVRFYLCDERLHPLCEQCGGAGRLDLTRCRACRPKGTTPLVLAVEDPTAAFRLANGQSTARG
jgi:hypothetical protein